MVLTVLMAAKSAPTLVTQAVVDIATLTGACMVALGPGIAGLMTPSEDMVSRVTAASKAAGMCKEGTPWLHARKGHSSDDL